MRIASAILLVLASGPASAFGGDYKLSARLVEGKAMLGSLETTISADEEVSFTRSGASSASFSIKLIASDRDGLCLGVNAELEGNWGDGNISSACVPFELGIPVEFNVLDEGVLHIFLRK